jgi:hypothetical protein
MILATFPYSTIKNGVTYPTILTVSPDIGDDLTINTSITITGTNFTPESVVKINNILCPSIVYVSPTQLIVSSPSLTYSATAYDILVTTQYGAAKKTAAYSSFDFVLQGGWLALWIAGVNETLDAGKVSIWGDASGNGHICTMTNYPTPIVADPLYNNQRTLDFAGECYGETDNFLISQPVSVYLIGNPIVGDCYLFDGIGSSPFNVSYYTDKLWYMYAGGVNQKTTVDPIEPNKHLYVWNFNSASSAMYMDGASVPITGGALGTSHLHGCLIGDSSSGAEGFKGKIALFAFRSGAFDAEVMAVVWKYAAWKYGLT